MESVVVCCLLLLFGHQFLISTLNICRKYDLFQAGETCRCSNDLLRILSIADLGTLQNSWEKRETPFGETVFLAVGLWLAVQVTQTIVPQVRFWCFGSKSGRFLRYSVSPFYVVFTPKTGFSSKNRPLCLPSGRDRSLPSRRDFGAGDTTLGRPSR